MRGSQTVCQGMLPQECYDSLCQCGLELVSRSEEKTTSSLHANKEYGFAASLLYIKHALSSPLFSQIVFM